MRIAMYGGTFDPFHAEHAAIARFVLVSRYADKVLLIPAPVPPHKNCEGMTPYDVRRKLIELGTAGMDGVEISDMERDRSGKSYSLDTLDELAALYPHDEIILLIGGDSLATLHLWSRAHEIVRKYRILTFPRPGFSVTDVSLRTAHWSPEETEKLLAGIMQDVPESAISATEIRDLLARGLSLPAGTMADAELAWIRQHHLYEK